jgi:hypothetical protein
MTMAVSILAQVQDMHQLQRRSSLFQTLSVNTLKTSDARSRAGLTHAQAKEPNPVVTATRRVVEIISSDPAKIETYCAIGNLGVQIEDASKAKDKKTADVLTEKMRGLEKQLGPEYLSLMYGLQTIDPESDDGVEIDAMLKPLDRPCALE